MMPNLENKYPNWLWIARKNKGLKQKSVAQRLGANDTHLSRYESGLVSPNLYMALKLSILYGVTVDDLYKPLIERLKQEIAPVEHAVHRGGIPASRAFYL